MCVCQIYRTFAIYISIVARKIQMNGGIRNTKWTQTLYVCLSDNAKNDSVMSSSDKIIIIIIISKIIVPKMRNHQAHSHIRAMLKTVIFIQNRGCEWCSPFFLFSWLFFLFFFAYIWFAFKFVHIKIGNSSVCWCRLLLMAWLVHIAICTLYAYYRYVTCSNKEKEKVFSKCIESRSLT